MTKRRISDSRPAASTPSISEIVLNVANVKGAVSAALETVQHDDTQAAGALELAVAEMGRIQEDLEAIQRLGKRVVAGSGASKTSTPAADTGPAPDVTASDPRSTARTQAEIHHDKLEGLQQEVLDVLAVCSVVGDALDPDTGGAEMIRLLDLAENKLIDVSEGILMIAGEIAEVANG